MDKDGELFHYCECETTYQDRDLDTVRWEYHLEFVRITAIGQVADGGHLRSCNELGQEGWEMVTMLWPTRQFVGDSKDDGYWEISGVGIFKRKKEIES